VPYLLIAAEVPVAQRQHQKDGEHDPTRCRTWSRAHLFPATPPPTSLKALNGSRERADEPEGPMTEASGRDSNRVLLPPMRSHAERGSAASPTPLAGVLKRFCLSLGETHNPPSSTHPRFERWATGMQSGQFAESLTKWASKPSRLTKCSPQPGVRSGNSDEHQYPRLQLMPTTCCRC
jgi:hypothetical protein